MEPLVAGTLDEARAEAQAVLDFYTSGIAARIFQGDREIAALAREA